MCIWDSGFADRWMFLSDGFGKVGLEQVDRDTVSEELNNSPER